MVDKNDLLAAVWTGRVVHENNLAQAIKPYNPNEIVTPGSRL